MPLLKERLRAVDASGASIPLDLRELGYDAVEEARSSRSRSSPPWERRADRERAPLSTCSRS